MSHFQNLTVWLQGGPLYYCRLIAQHQCKGIIMPPLRGGGIKRWCCLDVCLSDVWRLSVWRLSRTSGRRVACAAGRLDGAYWLIGPGAAGPTRLAWLNCCRCALPLQAWAGVYRGGRPQKWSKNEILWIVGHNPGTNNYFILSDPLEIKLGQNWFFLQITPFKIVTENRNNN